MYITCPISDHTVPVSIFDVRLHWVQLFFETPATKSFSTVFFDSVPKTSSFADLFPR